MLSGFFDQRAYFQAFFAKTSLSDFLLKPNDFVWFLVNTPDFVSIFCEKHTIYRAFSW